VAGTLVPGLRQPHASALPQDEPAGSASNAHWEASH